MHCILRTTKYRQGNACDRLPTATSNFILILFIVLGPQFAIDLADIAYQMNVIVSHASVFRRHATGQ